MILTDVRNMINKILLTNTVRENSNLLAEHIPEIKSMIGFEHKHPQHHLDVWEHTLLVLGFLAEENDLELKMAALFHDIGKPVSYQDGVDRFSGKRVRHFHGHPNESELIARNRLYWLEYDITFIKDVCYLIKFHDTIIEKEDLEYYPKRLVIKRLKLQYADAKAHHPDTIEKRLERLDEVKRQLHLSIS